MNEWVTVRREERAIYTHSRNPTVQIYVESYDTDRRDFRPFYKTLFMAQSKVINTARAGTLGGTSGLSTFVETPDDQPSRGG
jgi:hypothetical protein